MQLRVREFIDWHCLLSPGMRVLIGVSGGSDSVALLHLLRTLAPGYGLELHVVHLNHMLRPEAAEDAAFVRKLAHRWGLPATIGCAKVCSLAGRLKIGLEEAGRLRVTGCSTSLPIGSVPSGSLWPTIKATRWKRCCSTSSAAPGRAAWPG